MTQPAIVDSAMAATYFTAKTGRDITPRQANKILAKHATPAGTGPRGAYYWHYRDMLNAKVLDKQPKNVHSENI